MITCLACTCHNAESIIRRVLRTSHYPNYLSQPIIRGKAACLSYLEGLEPIARIEALKMYIEKNSSWAVVLGQDEDEIDWAEVGHGGVKARLDGQIIVERYGNGSTS